MRFLLLFKANPEYEAGILPEKDHVAELARFNEELMQAGVLLAVDALYPSSKGARISFRGDERIVTDGPFAETKELIAGYWLWQVSSKEEAIQWLKRAPITAAEVELRQVYEAEDLGVALKPEPRK